jgi:hypothetical protein
MNNISLLVQNVNIIFLKLIRNYFYKSFASFQITIFKYILVIFYIRLYAVSPRGPYYLYKFPLYLLII